MRRAPDLAAAMLLLALAASHAPAAGVGAIGTTGDEAQAAGAQAVTPKVAAPSQAPAPAAVQGAIIKVYMVRAATPRDLVEIIKQTVPEVTAVLGPQPRFIRDTPKGEALGTEDKKAAPPPTGPVSPDVSIADQFIRQIILRGSAEAVQRAIDLLTEIDVPVPQVLIEAKILDISEDASRAIGITWDFAPTGTTSSFTLGKPTSHGKWTDVVFGRLSRDAISFNAALEAAILQNKARLLASPKVMALYNHRARIFIGDEVTYLLGTKINQNGTTLETGQVNVGVELNVEAVGNPDGTINLKVNPEVGSLLQLDTQANGISLPTISRRTVNTSVRLKDGETLVIGGLLNESETKSVRKLPILGDLPFLGQLFRRDGRDKSRSELVITLKASIVKE
ncbi:MAG TPA: hypothetical protein VKT77_14490 [Chthonomonadaceae bacterium]|nr:hypothetical protein [Chthonomonadaceae bacterium]